MYDDLLTGIKTILTASGLFGSVQAGLARPSAYPAASVWLQKCVAGSGKIDPIEEVSILVQIQGYAEDDTDQGYLDMVALVADVKHVLHQARLPGKGCQALVVPEFEAMRMEQGGPTVYVLRVTARILPSVFSIN